ncbi:hypothetical protein IWQ62_003983, partial [Dispira parvispora]
SVAPNVPTRALVHALIPVLVVIDIPVAGLALTQDLDPAVAHIGIVAVAQEHRKGTDDGDIPDPAVVQDHLVAGDIVNPTAGLLEEAEVEANLILRYLAYKHGHVLVNVLKFATNGSIRLYRQKATPPNPFDYSLHQPPVPRQLDLSSDQVVSNDSPNSPATNTKTTPPSTTAEDNVSTDSTNTATTTATSTASKKATGTTKGDLIMIVCFFTLVVLSVVGTWLYFYITDKTREPEMVLLDRMQTQKEVESLVENLYTQLRTLKSMPLPWTTMRPDVLHNVLSWWFVVGIILSLGVLTAGFLKSTAYSSDTRSSVQSNATRQYPTSVWTTFPTTTTDAESGTFIMNSDGPDQTSSPILSRDFIIGTDPTSNDRGHHSSGLTRRQELRTRSPSLVPRAVDRDEATPKDIIADLQVSEGIMMAGTFLFFITLNFFFMTRQHLYYRRRKTASLDRSRHHVISKTAYSHYEKNWQNTIQIVTLVLEFLQLLFFPLRDLITNTDIIQINDSTSDTLDIIMGLVSFFPRLSSSFFIILFWTVFTAVFVFFFVAIALHWINSSQARREQGRSVPIYWVSYFVPIVSLLYLPILVVFVSSAQCLSKQVFNLKDQEDPDQGGLLKCHAPNVQPVAYFIISLVGYTVAYVMMTTFVTSYDRTPVEGEILFKSKPIAIIKNLSLLLTIDFLLVPSHFNRLRSTLSLVILIGLVCVNLKLRPCYVDQINFWRSGCFCCILWTGLLVAMLNNQTSQVRRMSVGGIVGCIIGGMVAIVIIFVLIHYCGRNFSMDTWVDIRATEHKPLADEPIEPTCNVTAGVAHDNNNEYQHYLRDSNHYASLRQFQASLGKHTSCDYNLVDHDKLAEALGHEFRQSSNPHLAVFPATTPSTNFSPDISLDPQLLLRGPHNASSYFESPQTEWVPTSRPFLPDTLTRPLATTVSSPQRKNSYKATPEFILHRARTLVPGINETGTNRHSDEHKGSYELQDLAGSQSDQTSVATSTKSDSTDSQEKYTRKSKNANDCIQPTGNLSRSGQEPLSDTTMLDSNSSLEPTKPL